jgi:predicted ATPase
LHLHRGEWRKAQEGAEDVLSLATEHGLAQLRALGTLVHGWTLTKQGQVEKGLVHMGQGLTAIEAVGSEVARVYFLALLAEVYSQVGRAAEGLHVLDTAQTVAQRTAEHASEAELHRLKGELLLQQSSDNAVEAESCFHQAITIAQSQSAKSWELRAATSLAKLWQSQDKCKEAYDLLAPVYGWFTEGHDTADLIDAKAQLDELQT